MKRNISVLKIAGLLLVVGLVLYFVGMSAFANDGIKPWGGSTELVYEKKDYTANAAGIEEIRIHRQQRKNS
jgi:hypothetical protein